MPLQSLFHRRRRHHHKPAAIAAIKPLQFLSEVPDHLRSICPFLRKLHLATYLSLFIDLIRVSCWKHCFSALCFSRSNPSSCVTAGARPRFAPLQRRCRRGLRPSLPRHHRRRFGSVGRPFSKRANSFDRTNPCRSVTLFEDYLGETG